MQAQNFINGLGLERHIGAQQRLCLGVLCQPARQNAHCGGDGANLTHRPVAQNAGDLRHGEQAALHFFMHQRRCHIMPRRNAVLAPLL